MGQVMQDLFHDVDVTEVAKGMGWGEGPAYVESLSGYVFTDIVATTLYIWRGGEPEVLRSPSFFANGNTTDREGRLVTCEHQTRRVSRTEHDGSITVISDTYEGKPLNSPNDVVVASDGAIWFTDPPYGILRGECGPDAVAHHPSGVYRWDPRSTKLERLVSILDKPNGLALAADETALYVSDTGYSHRSGGSHHIFRFDLVDCRPLNMSVFATIDPGGSDGFRIDAAGYVWSSAGDGVQCFSTDGALVGRIALDEMATNLCFLEGGERGVFVTTPTRALVCRLALSGGTSGFGRDGRLWANSAASER